jgi:hypothetical protein
VDAWGEWVYKIKEKGDDEGHGISFDNFFQPVRSVLAAEGRERLWGREVAETASSAEGTGAPMVVH